MAAGFFDVDERLKRLSDLGDQLEAYRRVVNFETFRQELVAALSYTSGAHGGRPPFDPVMMLKILVIQTANNLSDERTEFLINDRLSFMRFLGLDLSDRVPDARTIWLFRERLTKAGAIERLFERFDGALRDAGYIAMSGQIVASSRVAAPKQRATRRTRGTTSRPASCSRRHPIFPQRRSLRSSNSRESWHEDLRRKWERMRVHFQREPHD